MWSQRSVEYFDKIFDELGDNNNSARYFFACFLLFDED